MVLPYLLHSFYVGWRCGPSAFEMALEISAKVFQYAEKLGYHFTLVDVGGGFSCCTTPADIDQFQKQAASVNKGLQQYFAGYPNLKAIGEPGVCLCVCVCMCVCICTCFHVCVHMCVCTHVCVYVCMHMCMCVFGIGLRLVWY